MSELSIKKTLSQSFSTYFSHWTILAPIGAFLGFLTICWKQILFAIHSYMTTTTINSTYNSSEKLSFIKTVLTLIGQTTSTHYLITIFAIIFIASFGFIYSFIYFSFFKELIDFEDKKSINIASLFKWEKSYLKSIAGFFLLTSSLGFCAGLLVIIMNFSTLPFHLHRYLFIPGLLVIVSILLYVAIRLWLFYFFILDKDYSILDSFKASWTITKNSFFKFFAFLVISSMISAGILFILTILLNFILGNCHYEGIINQSISIIISSAISTPLLGLILVNCYKELTD